MTGWRPLGRWLTPDLGALRQYPPRPLALPATYHLTSPLADPPRIALVTPSLNQGEFLARTLDSVLGQCYPRLDYVVQDGDSRDQTLGLLERYRAALSHVESAPDRGQADALNRGFARARGELMGYLNADDLLLPGALAYVARYFAAHPEVDVVYGHRVLIDEEDREVGRWVLPPHDDGMLLWRDYVPQETLFWRRRLWERTGSALDESYQFALDWELLLRFLTAGARFVRLPRFLGAFRVHARQKTAALYESVGRDEIGRLRRRIHGRAVSEAEVARRLRPYLARHLFCRWMYNLGLVRY
jgi:glycosyltransferase involved in cell wall biosynthesis